MNFVGTFDAKLPIEGPGAHPNAQLHVDSVTTHAPADAIIVPDAHLLFTGDFKRSGVDLILSKDAHELVLHDYFKGEKRAALASPDGAHLTGDLVNTLAGHVDYAQADGSASVATVIGHVTKLTGSATAIRNGVSIILNQGDNVDKGDVVQAGSDSSLGITFIDGTVFGLSSNAKMVLNEMVYDPNGSNNSSLLSLVAGTISFVAGETAKHGDMKIDTPVATMGIRGTAVLVEIDFDVPQGGGPDAKFQVLVEPDGTTGSYILFDKNTLDPIATVNQAGTQTIFSHGVVSFLSTAQLSPDAQKLITEVFAQKFTDNTNVNTKSFDHYTDTLLPQTFTPFFLAEHPTVVPIFLNVSGPSGPAPASSNGPGLGIQHISQAPTVVTTGGSITETPHVTHSTTADTVSGQISFADVNAGDFPTAKTSFTSFTYQNAAHTDVTSTLSALQLKDIGLVEANLVVVPTPGNNNNGSATWTYSVADGAFDFLAAGETLTLTYTAEVDSNYLPNNLSTLSSFTITIIGTNDAPVITTGPQTIAFSGGITTPGGDLTSNTPTQGTLDFTDADLTDTHTVSTKLTTMSLSGATVPPAPLAIFENALSASIATDSSGTGNGIIDWKLADLPVYLADFIPNGQTLTLTYTVTLTDSQGAPTIQHVTVNITGTGTPAVVWIATTSGPSPGGLWSDPSNWETGTAPIATDDAIIITDQLIGLTPSYPVTISTAAVAKSLTMNDFGTLFTNQPTLINDSALTVGAGGITLHADAIIENGDATHGSATITVGGAMEVLDQSALQNYGLITLQDGGDFKNQSTITNFSSGTIEVAGGTLNVQVGIANSGAVTIDPHATLTLNGGAISGGTVTDTAGGTLDLAGGGVVKDGRLANAGTIDVTGTGNALDHETVTVNYSLEVMAGGELTLDLGTTVANGTITVDGALLTLNSDGTTSTTPAAALTLNSAVITGGGLSNYGTVFVEGSVGATFDDVSVTNSRTIQVDVIMPAGPLTTLTLDDGTSIAGGHLNIGSLGVLEIAYGTTGPGATLDGGVSVGNSGVIRIDNGATLTLNGATINGGTVKDFSSAGGGIIDVTGASKIAGTSASDADLTGAGFTSKVTLDAALTLDDVRLNDVSIEKGSSGVLTIDDTVEVAGPVQLLNDTVTNSGIIQVDDGQTLTLSGTEIIGGTINDGTLAGGPVASTGLIDVTGTSKIDGNVALNDGYVTIESGKTLTLDDVTVSGTTVTEETGSSLIQINATDTLTLEGGATIQGVPNAVKGAIGNSGTIEIAGAATLLNDTLTNATATGSIIQVDDGQTLTLSGTEIIGGTINDGTLAGGPVAATGLIDVMGTSKIDGNVTLNDGYVTIESGKTLTLDDVTVSGTTVTEEAGSSLIQIDATDTLTLEGGATIQGVPNAVKGAISNSGTIEVAGAATLLDDTLTNTSASGSIIQIDDDQTLKLSGTEIIGGTINDGTLAGGPVAATGLIDVMGTSKIDGNVTLNDGYVTIESGKTLTLDDVTVSGTTVTEEAGSSLIQIDATDTLTLEGGATIQGVPNAVKGAISNSGTIEVAGAATLLDDTLTNTSASGSIIQIDDDQTLKLSGTEIIGGTINDSSPSGTGGTIDVTGSSKIDGGASLNDGAVTVESGQTLKLDDVTVSGTTVTEEAGSSLIQIDATDTLTLEGGATIQGVPNAVKGAISNSGTIEVAGAATLLDDTLTNTSASGSIIQIDDDQTLKLSGTEIIGGTINDSSPSGTGGTIDVTGSSKIDGGASLNDGAVTVESGVTLTLDDVTVSGTTVTEEAGSSLIQIDATDTLTLEGGATIQGVPNAVKGAISNSGTIEVAGAATLLDDTLTNTSASGSIIQIDDDQTLKLSGTEIIGGTINDSSPSGTGGTIDVTGSSKIDGGASLNDGAVTVESGVTLTLDDVTVSGTTVTEEAGSSLIQVDATDTLTLEGGAIIQGVPNAVKGAISNSGTIEVAGAATLLDDTLTNTSASGSIIQIDDDQTLKLSGTEIIGGTINDSSPSGTGGTIDVTGSSKIDGGASLNDGAVTVESGVTLTLDDVTVSGTTVTEEAGSSLIQIDATDTLTLEGGATIQGVPNAVKGAISNSGTIEVAGAATLLDDTLTNTSASGSIIQIDDDQTLKLSGTEIIGGTINDSSPSGTGGTIDVTGSSKIDGDASLNDGAVTVESGVTLTLDDVTVTGTEIDGTDGGPGATSIIQIDSGTTLTLGSGASVHDGTINISSNGILEIEASSGATLNGVSITGTGHTQIDGPTVSSGLLLEGGTSMTGGTLTIGSVGTLEIATALGATLNNVRVINNYMIEVRAGGILTLDLGTTVTNATGTIDIDPAGSTCAATLELNGTTVNGGTINDNGTIDVTGNSAINGITAHFHTTNAALNDGSVTVESGVFLTLDNVSVTGTTFSDSGTIKVDNNRTLLLNDVTVNGGTISDNGTIDITGDSSIHGITALGITTNAILYSGDVTVESGDTLTLDNVTATGTTFNDAGATLTVVDMLVLNGVTINGGTINDNGTIDVTGNSSIYGITSFFGFGTTTNAVLNNGFVKVESGKILTLDNVTVNGTTFNDSGTVGVDDDDALVLNGAVISGGKIAGNGLIEVTGTGNALNNVAVTDTGTIEVSAGGALTLDRGTTVDNTYGVITIDGAVTGHNAAPAAILTLNLATINGGTINDNGTIDVTGNSSINGTTATTWFGATITTNAVLKGGKVAVETGSKLTLDNVAVNSSTFDDYGTFQIDSGAMLMLAGTDLIAGISGSSIADAGTIDVTGTTTLDTDSLSDTGTLKVDGTLKLLHTAVTGGTITDNGTIDVASDSSINGTTANAILNGGKVTVESGVTFTLDGDTVSGTKFTDAGTVHIDGFKTLTLDNVTVTGGAITDAGTIQVDSGKTLTLDNVTVSGGGAIADHGTIQVDSFKVLTLDDVSITGGAIANNGSIHVDSLKTLTLDNVTVTGGTISNSGTIQVDGGDKLTLDNVDISGGTINDNGVVVVTGGTTIASNTAIHGSAVFEIDASTRNEALTHYGVTDTFVFNFDNVGHDTVSHFDTAHDTLQFSSSIFTSAQAALDATHYIGNNAVITLDNHGDTITLTGIHVGQLHASDFHISV